MAGLRNVGIFGAALALTGGVAYFFYNFIYKGRRAPRKLKQLTNAEKREKAPAKKERRTESARSAPAQAEAPVAGTQVLVLGLEGAGKTSLLHCMATDGLDQQDVRPTQGFNAVSINREKLHIEFLEIGGAENLRDYWQKYLVKARLLVFVVDSADAGRFPLAKTHLHQLLTDYPYLPLVVLAHKQDLPGAHGVAELYEALGLGSIGDAHKLCVLGTQMHRGRPSPSVQDAREVRSSPSPRILQLAQHKESKRIWVTTPESGLTWGNQEPIWPLSLAALGTVPSDRIERLAKHKDFSSFHQDLPRKEEEEENEMRKMTRPFSQAAQYELVVRLATPMSRCRTAQEVSPPHSEWCEYSCPVWHVNPALRKAVVSPHLLQLARPKNTHPDFRSNRLVVQTLVSRAAKTAQVTPRLEQLSLPRVRPNSLFCELGWPDRPIWPVSKSARKATASARVIELSTPKPLAQDYLPPRDLTTL